MERKLVENKHFQKLCNKFGISSKLVPLISVTTLLQLMINKAFIDKIECNELRQLSILYNNSDENIIEKMGYDKE